MTIQDFHALHSTSRSGADWGETDIELRFTALRHGTKASVIVLVENKVNAPFTERQAERYREACDRAKADMAKCVLLCPRGYAESHPIFDAVIHYESMRNFLVNRCTECDGELAGRLRHRAQVLDWAITKSRRPYVPEPDPVNTTFWHQYAALMRMRAPELRINEGAKGGRD